MPRLQSTLFWTIIMSETMHVFCCLLPTVISLISLFGGIGLLTMLPSGVMVFHDMLHRWEIPLIAFSGIVLALGWSLHILSMKLDCRSEAGCAHEPCGPKKKNAALVLKIASVMFVVNTTFYITFHMHQ